MAGQGASDVPNRSFQTRLMDGIVVYPANMKKNLGLSLGMWNTARAYIMALPIA